MIIYGGANLKEIIHQ